MEKEKIPFLDIEEMRKRAKDILVAIAPIFKGKSIEYVDGSLASARRMLREECPFTLRPSLLSSRKRRKT